MNQRYPSSPSSYRLVDVEVPPALSAENSLVIASNENAIEKSCNLNDNIL